MTRRPWLFDDFLDARYPPGPPRLLGFDPGLAKVGWCVGELFAPRQLRIIDLGTWVTKLDKDRGFYADHVARALDIGIRADRLMNVHKPLEVFVEEQGRMPSATAYAVLRVAAGFALAAALRELRYSERTSQDIKKTLTGDRSAAKEVVEDEVLRYVTPEALERFQKAHPRMKRSTKRGLRDHAFDAGGAMVAGLVDRGILEHEPLSVRARRARHQ